MKPKLLRLISLVFAAVATSIVCAQAEVQRGSAVVKYIDGVASYVDAQGSSHVLTRGTTLEAGCTVVTGPSTRLSLRFEPEGSVVGLDADSRLKIEQLDFHQSATGRITETMLDLQAGQLLGSVEKLKAGSKFEVKTPKSTASVRGTLFYIDAVTGDVHVVQGVVDVTVNLAIEGEGTLTRTISVDGGQSLLLPKVYGEAVRFGEAEHNSLAPVYTSSSLTAKLLAWTAEKNYGLDRWEGLAETGEVTIDFDARRLGNDNIWVLRPPEINVVSY